MFLRITSDRGSTSLDVDTFDQASRKVREFIERRGLGAGCSDTTPAFRSAVVSTADRRKKLARISYNGRVWDFVNDTEILTN